MAKEIVKKEDSLKAFEKNFQESIIKAKEGLELLKENARFKINSQKKLEESKEIMVSVKEEKENAKLLRDWYYKPIYDFSQLIYRPIKEYEDEVKKIEDFHKAEQLAWLRKLQEEEDKKRKEIEEKLEKEEISLDQAGKKLEKVESKVEAIKGVTTRRVVKIVDFAKVPDKYKLPNMPLLNEDILRGNVEVPGTQVVEEQSLSNR
ncbi:hypothetical protein [Methanoculleus sp.]|uniref:hypothetical protein n=1 Tax=Methanoculleus sp. TaxID=90427 RepID=UPI0025D48925|nr:hypothetical protein [Methanoculleus sp.]MCK9318914.1 hypothetical protein [Methanoculleus sp.]